MVRECGIWNWNIVSETIFVSIPDTLIMRKYGGTQRGQHEMYRLVFLCTDGAVGLRRSGKSGRISEKPVQRFDG